MQILDADNLNDIEKNLPVSNNISQEITHSPTNEVSNISGTVFIPDKPSKDPIAVYSTAEGKKTQIKNNQEFKIENQDLSVELSGYYEGGKRGQRIILTMFHPDETTHVIKTFLDSKQHYVIPTKILQQMAKRNI